MLEANFGLLLILGAIGLVLCWLRPISEWFEQRRFQRERLRFAKEVAEGKEPDWCPTTTNFDGVIRVSTDDLLYTKEFKEQIKHFKTS